LILTVEQILEDKASEKKQNRLIYGIIASLIGLNQ
jgi:hypothetical protein